MRPGHPEAGGGKKAYEDIVRQIRTLIEEGKLKRNEAPAATRELFKERPAA
jgi:DNA-binding FadR family transcriptional regulator